MSLLEYTGKYKKDNQRYSFKMKNGKIFTSQKRTALINPTFDNSFQNMFCSDKKILKSLLNSVLFPESKLIKRLEYSKIYFAGKGEVNKRYGLGAKSIDLGCKCFLKKDNNIKIKDNILMVDVEMQIGFSDAMEERFIDYTNTIKVDSSYKDTWVVSFILKESLDKNFTIKLNKVNSQDVISIKNYQSIKLIEINLNYCYSLIEQDEEIIINKEKLSSDGREWLKFLSCPIWCDEDNIKDDIYIFPLYTKKNFLSCVQIKNAIEKIIITDEAIDLSKVDEHYNKIERKKYAKACKKIKKLEEELAFVKQKLKMQEEKEKNDNSDEEDEEEKEENKEDEEDPDENEEENDDSSNDDNDQESEKMDLDD